VRIAIARTTNTRAQVRALLGEGKTRLEVARLLGLTKSTVSYHARRLELPIDEKCARRYDWTEIQRYYDMGHSVSECQARFGFARETWNQARRRGDVKSRPQAMPVETLLVVGRPTNRSHLKSRLFTTGLKENRCERCGIAEWRGKALAMALHHINGNRRDNRLQNLSLLCPNCHSQTPNFSGRNTRRKWAWPAELRTIVLPLRGSVS
jgi:hypothetical protein